MTKFRPFALNAVSSSDDLQFCFASMKEVSHLEGQYECEFVEA